MMSLSVGRQVGAEVEEWLSSLPIVAFGTVAFHIDRLAEQVQPFACRTRGRSAMVSSSCVSTWSASLSGITYFFPGGHRIVLLTEFRKQRMNERAEIDRARATLARCVREGHTAEEDLR